MEKMEKIDFLFYSKYIKLFTNMSSKTDIISTTDRINDPELRANINLKEQNFDTKDKKKILDSLNRAEKLYKQFMLEMSNCYYGMYDNVNSQNTIEMLHNRRDKVISKE